MKNILHGNFHEKYIQVLNPCFLIWFMVVHAKHYKLKIKLNMFWVNRKKTPIQQEIEDFAESRKNYITTSSQVRHLYDFVKITGVQSFEDVTQIDIDSYNNTIRETVNSVYLQNVAIQAVQLFMKYRKIKFQKDQPKKRRGRPEKLKRNENILALRELKNDDGKPLYSLSMIGKKYRLSKVTVHEIVKRLENKG